jgi:hypothetical protein
MAKKLAGAQDRRINAFYHQSFSAWVYWRITNTKLLRIDIVYPFDVNPHGHIVIKDGVICYWRRIDGTVLVDNLDYLDEPEQ